MDMYRAFLAIVISFVILIGYQYFFVPVEKPVQPSKTQEQVAAPEQPGSETVREQGTPGPLSPSAARVVQPDPTARDITVDTPYYTAVINEQGGGFKSFVLKGYQRQKKGDTSPMQLVQTSQVTELPARFFAWKRAERQPAPVSGRQDKTFPRGRFGHGQPGYDRDPG
jgi:YidC/Oxa1 family membrane protein insertase